MCAQLCSLRIYIYSFGGRNENYFFISVVFGDCAPDISDQTRWWGNYQWSVVICTVVACRLAVATRCERGIRDSPWYKEKLEIYLLKEGKENYSKAKSNRSISLTSTVGKIFECALDSQFRAWFEEFGLLDSFQYAYNKDHNLTQALLCYSLQATKGQKTGYTV